MKDLGKLINKMIDKAIVGCDKYVNNHSTWLIFTDEKKWVIELTKDGTLWYNYNFFKNLFKVLSLDVVENQNYITKWVEDTIINGVKNTKLEMENWKFVVEDTIQNGVKETKDAPYYTNDVVDTIIQNGVKHTEDSKDLLSQERAEDTIENGVKHTRGNENQQCISVENTIENGVKHTIDTTHHKNKYVEDAIKNGVKETKTPGEDGDILGVLDFLSDNNTVNIPQLIDDVIDNGVKYTGGIGNPNWMGNKVEKAIENGVKETHRDAERHPKTVEDAIQNGVKKTYSDKIPHEYDWSDQFTEDVEYTIQNGVKHTEKSLQIDGSCVIEDVLKNGIKETHDDVYHHTGRVEGVIKNGIKETKLIDYSDNTEFIVNGVISRGIKE